MSSLQKTNYQSTIGFASPDEVKTLLERKETEDKDEALWSRLLKNRKSVAIVAAMCASLGLAGKAQIGELTSSLTGSEPVRAFDVDDLRIRFNKLERNGRRFFVEDEPVILGVSDYPIQNSKFYNDIVEFSNADSVVLPNDFQLDQDRSGIRIRSEQWESVDFWLTKRQRKLEPIYPGMEDFWEEMKIVVDAQKARQANATPFNLQIRRNGDTIYWPDIWFNRNQTTDKKTSRNPGTRLNFTSLEDIAKAVDGEYPAYHQEDIIETLAAQNTPGNITLTMDRTLADFRSNNDFIGTVVRLGAINTWAFEAVAPINFMIKWSVGMPRPEEIARLIANGDIIPPDSHSSMVDDIRGIYKKTAEEKGLELNTSSIEPDEARYFTAYESGSPNHPSFPAMHSAGSTVSFWLPVIAKITPKFCEAYCELLRVDYAVAMGRTVAGVHYPQDNIAGLNTGQKIVKTKLPKFLEKEYDYDARKVKDKMKKLDFNWTDFDSNDCTIDGVKVDEFLANAMGVPKCGYVSASSPIRNTN